MDPHLLRTFAAVARHGSFSEAAQELGFTQSAVSQHIAALEKDLGADLLRRRPVAPTPAGLRLLEHTGPLLLRLDAARTDLARLTAAPSARIAIAASAPAMTPRLAEDLARTRQAQPTLDVSLRVLGREAVVEHVAAGRSELGLIDGVAAPNDPLHLHDTDALTTRAVAEHPLAVALPARHPLADQATTSLRLADLADARWIDAPDTAIPLAQLRTISGFDGFRASLRYEGTDTQGLTALVAAGHGLALLPTRLVNDVTGLAAIPVREPRLVHRTEVLHSSTLDGPAADLATALTRAAR